MSKLNNFEMNIVRCIGFERRQPAVYFPLAFYDALNANIQKSGNLV